MALLAFGGGRRLLRSFLAFLALSCALGGGVLALSLLGARGVGLERGVLSPHVDLGVLLLSSAGCYAAASLVFRRSAGHGSRELVEAVLTLEGALVRLDMETPARAPTPGQLAVFYDGDTVIGSAWIQ